MSLYALGERCPASTRTPSFTRRHGHRGGDARCLRPPSGLERCFGATTGASLSERGRRFRTERSFTRPQAHGHRDRRRLRHRTPCAPRGTAPSRTAPWWAADRSCCIEPVGAGALVGAGAVVPNGTEVPAERWPGFRQDPTGLGRRAAFADNVAHYVSNGHRYRADLRRLD